MKTLSASLLTLFVLLTATEPALAQRRPAGPVGPSQPASQPRQVRYGPAPNSSPGVGGAALGLLCVAGVGLSVVCMVVATIVVIVVTVVRSSRPSGRPRKQPSTAQPCDRLPDAVEAHWDPSGHR
jgi:hypothetical protein